MLEVIEKLLILQDRDRKIAQIEAELRNVGPERSALLSRQNDTRDRLERVRHKAMQIETDRKKLELEVDSKKQQIERYALQQFQTKKNEEYRALANEIENCKIKIAEIEDQQLLLMEEADAAQRETVEAAHNAEDAARQVELQLADLAAKEKNLQAQLKELRSNHDQLSSAVESSALLRYERLRQHKGPNAVVAVSHGVCGGCHMKIPTHLVHSCRAERELVSCPNCSRILFLADE